MKLVTKQTTDLLITLEIIQIQLSLFQGGEMTDDHHLPRNCDGDRL